VFGPEAKTRVWLVLDGDTLYVDRNGNSDLTEPGEKVFGKKKGDSVLYETVNTFDIGELRDGGRRNLKGTLTVTHLDSANGLSQFSADVKALLARDPRARSYHLHMEVEVPGHRGVGTDGRVLEWAGPDNPDGWLQFADRPQDAPVLHFGGPWTITLYSRPTLRLNREVEMYLGVGTPGRGQGTFVFIGYEGAVPADLFPRAEITFPPRRPGDAPVKAVYELKERC
jgi:hypothetical protein